MIMDETLHSVSERVKNFAIIWKVDISEVPDFTKVRFSPNRIPADSFGLRCDTLID